MPLKPDYLTRLPSGFDSVLATNLESTLTDNDCTFIFFVILNTVSSDSYWLLVLVKLSRKACVLCLVGMIRTNPAPEPLMLDAPIRIEHPFFFVVYQLVHRIWGMSGYQSIIAYRNFIYEIR
ncbi:hypothetical protein Tco_0886714 [Tanacetum coccineum]